MTCISSGKTTTTKTQPYSANCIWGHIGLNSCRNYSQNKQASVLTPLGLSSTTTFQFQQICHRKRSHTEQGRCKGQSPLPTAQKRKGRGEGTCVVSKDIMRGWDWLQAVLQIVLRHQISDMTAQMFVPTHTQNMYQHFHPMACACGWDTTEKLQKFGAMNMNVFVAPFHFTSFIALL